MNSSSQKGQLNFKEVHLGSLSLCFRWYSLVEFGSCSLQNIWQTFLPHKLQTCCVVEIHTAQSIGSSSSVLFYFVTFINILTQLYFMFICNSFIDRTLDSLFQLMSVSPRGYSYLSKHVHVLIIIEPS